RSELSGPPRIISWRLVPRETTTLHVQEEDLKSHPNPTALDGNITKLKTEKGASQSKKKQKAMLPKTGRSQIIILLDKSSRKSKAELKAKHIEGKGRGVFAVRYFKKGKFVIEYHGDLMHLADAKERGALYAQDPGTGCYMYYFSKTYC
ncbi:unnamed protein product, partial [Oncorhynchus mykiss]